MSRMPEDFLNAYIEAALWSSTHTPDPEGYGPCCDSDAEFLDGTDHELSDEGRERMRADCEKFWAENEEDLEIAADAISALDRLTEACDKFGECDLYVGDDGKVYVS